MKFEEKPGGLTIGIIEAISMYLSGEEYPEAFWKSRLGEDCMGDLKGTLLYQVGVLLAGSIYISLWSFILEGARANCWTCDYQPTAFRVYATAIINCRHVGPHVYINDIEIHSINEGKSMIVSLISGEGN